MAFTILDATNITGVATATSFVKTGGTSSQFLMADGSTSTGSGGGIGGSIADTQVAYGTPTSNEITGDSTFVYNVLNGLTIGNAALNGSNAALTLNKGPAGQARLQLQSQGVTALDMKLDGSEDAYISAVNALTVDCGAGDDITMATNSTSGVGIGTTTPQSKLQVNGGIQMGTDGAADNIAAKAGTLRYREVTNIGTPKASNSYIDMYMRTGNSSYEWVNIVTSNW